MLVGILLGSNNFVVKNSALSTTPSTKLAVYHFLRKKNVHGSLGW